MQEMQEVPYKEVIGLLMFAMVATRADIAFDVSVMTQFISKPSPMDWTRVKRIMRYLKSTLDVNLCFGSMDLTLKGYCDADWGGDINSRSTTKAKYMTASQSAIWLRQLMANVGCVQERASTIMFDNQGYIALAINPSTIHSQSTLMCNTTSFMRRWRRR